MAGPQEPIPISTKQARIAMLAKKYSGERLKTLAHHMDVDWLREAFDRTRKDGATGIDGVSAKAFAANLEANLESLHERAKSGLYRAPPVRRVEIPKGRGKTRSIGIPTFEDKVLQRAVVMLLEPIYEEEFYDFSHGFRPRRSAHGAHQELRQVLWDWGGGWVLDADVSKFFDTLDRKQTQEFVRKRVADGVVLRLIGKWLRAGISTGGGIMPSTAGTPQGGVISPLLANIYLHEVLDRWWVEDVLPRLEGRAQLVRYADDFVMVFSKEADAKRVLEVLPLRFARFKLTLHPEKTRLVRHKRPPPDSNPPRGGSFDFVGFRHFWGRSRKGNWVPKVKTAPSRITRSLQAIKEWMARSRHLPLYVQARILSRKVQGHYNYFGVPGNSASIQNVYYLVERRWYRALSRRSQRYLTWTRFRAIVQRFPLPVPRLPPWRFGRLG